MQNNQMSRFMRFRFCVSWLLLLSLILCVSGCSSGGDGAGGFGPVATSTGVFLDSPVAGLNYTARSFEGETDEAGEFRYRHGEEVSFAIGELYLGEAQAAPVLTPLSITEGAESADDQIVKNKLILLQTLDEDGDLNNGIQISEDIREIVSAHAADIDFDQDPETFRASLTNLLAALNAAGVFSDSFYRGPRKARLASRALDHFQHSTSERVAFNTTFGPVICYKPHADYVQCLGIPYAKPPIGDLRWRDPVDPDPWTLPRHAVGFSDQAPQADAYSGSGDAEVSEDCLHLNVTAPAGASDLPVMVWFHGGGFSILTSSTKSYNNHLSLPTKGVVLVTVNHRLGALGYLAHPWLKAEQGRCGNYGQRDLIKALEWVRDNIATFGGDPGNVTLFGQSGGGAKAISLMASPLAKGLFHKVICQSGMIPGDGHFTEAQAMGIGSTITTGFADDLEDFRSKTWQEIITATDDKLEPLGGWVVLSPNQDGEYLTDTMENLIKAGLESDVPFMGGAVENDMMGPADLAPGVTRQMPWRKEFNSAPQYVYRWDFVPAGWAVLDPPVLAYHGIELVYTFNYGMSFATHQFLNLTNKTDAEIGVAYPRPPVGSMDTWAYLVLQSTGYFASFPFPSAASMEMANHAMTLWSNFAKSGNPNQPAATGLPTWNEYVSYAQSDDEGEYFRIGEDCEMRVGLASGFGPAP